MKTGKRQNTSQPLSCGAALGERPPQKCTVVSRTFMSYFMGVVIAANLVTVVCVNDGCLFVLKYLHQILERLFHLLD
jgi:hypothetical protein